MEHKKGEDQRGSCSHSRSKKKIFCWGGVRATHMAPDDIRGRWITWKEVCCLVQSKNTATFSTSKLKDFTPNVGNAVGLDVIDHNSRTVRFRDIFVSNLESKVSNCICYEYGLIEIITLPIAKWEKTTKPACARNKVDASHRAGTAGEHLGGTILPLQRGRACGRSAVTTRCFGSLVLDDLSCLFREAWLSVL